MLKHFLPTKLLFSMMNELQFTLCSTISIPVAISPDERKHFVVLFAFLLNLNPISLATKAVACGS
jgi:hypothetical protein